MDSHNTTIDELLSSMSQDLQTFLQNNNRQQPAMVGIHTGGVWVANALHKQLRLDEELGELNISFYRDDFSQIGTHPSVTPSRLPFSVEGRHIILVDDVLYTGRTIRAAMNELFDYGRPASITLVVLIGRDCRELPIHADVIGKSMALKENEHVKLSGPEPLALEIKIIE